MGRRAYPRCERPSRRPLCRGGARRVHRRYRRGSCPGRRRVRRPGPGRPVAAARAGRTHGVAVRDRRRGHRRGPGLRRRRGPPRPHRPGAPGRRLRRRVHRRAARPGRARYDGRRPDRGPGRRLHRCVRHRAGRADPAGPRAGQGEQVRRPDGRGRRTAMGRRPRRLGGEPVPRRDRAQRHPRERAGVRDRARRGRGRLYRQRGGRLVRGRRVVPGPRTGRRRGHRAG